MEPDEVTLTSGILLPFGFGWALLAVLSVRFSDQPQWWAAAPAVFFGLIGGLMLIWPNRLVLDVLGWVWPPALLGLVVLMIIGAHRRLRSRTREWLVYPLLVALTLAALGVAMRPFRITRRSLSSSTWADTGCTCSARARAAPRSCWSLASEKPHR